MCRLGYVMTGVSKDVRQILWNLGLLVGLIAVSLILFSFQHWLQANGGWPLLIAGLTCLWSALLLVLTAVREQRRRRREQAIDAAVAEIRRVIASAAEPRDDDGQPVERS